MSSLQKKRQENWKKGISNSRKEKCKNIEERIRLKEIGRKGGFGVKGYTLNGTYFQSSLEKACFELLENSHINFVTHKNLPDSAKECDIFFPDLNIWVELDGIDRESKKKWLGKEYENWENKIAEYRRKNLNFRIFLSFEIKRIFPTHF